MGLFPQSQIPEVYFKNNALLLPAPLWQAYRTQVIELGLHDECMAGHTHGCYGGPAEEDTQKHFAKLFANSASRVSYVWIDPENKLDSLPIKLLQRFSSHHVSLLDLAGGTGAGALTLLTVLAELRKHRHAPRLPLHVSILAADIADSALQIYQAMLNLLLPNLEDQAISVTFQTFKWDATLVQTTNELCDLWFSQERPNEYFVLVSNISGFGESKFRDAKRSIEHVEERLSNKTHSLLWLEPGMRSSRKIIKEITTLIDTIWKWLSREHGAPEGTEYGYDWWHVLQEKSIQSKVMVVSCKTQD